MKVLLTGSSGFVGRHLLAQLEAAGHELILLLRDTSISCSVNHAVFEHDLNQKNEHLFEAMRDVDVVIHLSSKVHDMSDKGTLDDYLKTNVEGTRELIRAAINSGVKQFIYLSTVKVYGDGCLNNLNEQTPLNPEDNYGLSKQYAEECLRELCEKSNLNFTIIRTPLVYGPGVKANFLSLIKLAKSGLPLPFKDINNKRSIIYVENLCAIIVLCMFNESAFNTVFAVKDVDVSISVLVKGIRRSLGIKEKLFTIPENLLKFLAKCLAKEKQFNRLMGNLSIDNKKMLNELEWKPLYSFEEGIHKTVQAAFPDVK